MAGWKGRYDSSSLIFSGSKKSNKGVFFSLLNQNG
jgi:hypothetical protein